MLHHALYYEQGKLPACKYPLSISHGDITRERKYNRSLLISANGTHRCILWPIVRLWHRHTISQKNDLAWENHVNLGHHLAWPTLAGPRQTREVVVFGSLARSPLLAMLCSVLQDSGQALVPVFPALFILPADAWRFALATLWGKIRRRGTKRQIGRKGCLGLPWAALGSL